MDYRGRSWRRAVARFAIGGLAGALLLVLGFAPSAFAAPVSHFAINNVALTEGNAGTTNLTFTISYTGTSNTISVDWATADGTRHGARGLHGVLGHGLLHGGRAR